MKLTAQELENMRSVNIGAVSADMLPEVDGMALDHTLSNKERIARFLHKAANPYCFCVGGVGVKIEFAEDGPCLAGRAVHVPFTAAQRPITIVPQSVPATRHSVPRLRHPC